MSTSVAMYLKSFRLPTMAALVEQSVKTAEAEDWGYERLLTGGSMSLLDAAAHLLGQADEAMRCKDLVDQARESGLWAPKRGGKTPARTLYAAILPSP